MNKKNAIITIIAVIGLIAVGFAIWRIVSKPANPNNNADPTPAPVTEAPAETEIPETTAEPSVEPSELITTYAPENTPAATDEPMESESPETTEELDPNETEDPTDDSGLGGVGGEVEIIIPSGQGSGGF